MAILAKINTTTKTKQKQSEQEGKRKKRDTPTLFLSFLRSKSVSAVSHNFQI